MRKCPECGSDRYVTERRLDGDTSCLQRGCGYTSKTSYWDANSSVDSTPTKLSSIDKFIQDLQRSRDKKLGICVLQIETAEEVMKLLEIISGISSLERGPSREMLQAEITKLQALIVSQQDHIDVLVSANEVVHQDKLGHLLDYCDEKSDNERLELKILDMEKQIETLQAALLDIITNKPVNTYRTNLGDALGRHSHLIEKLKAATKTSESNDSDAALDTKNNKAI